MSRATITLNAVGDLMLGDHPVCFGHGVRSTIEDRGFEHIAGDLPGLVADADIVFGNLESVLSDRGLVSDSLRSGELRGRPEYAEKLSDVGFNVLNVANNHIMQHGRPAFDETIERLGAEGVRVVGLAGSGGCHGETVVHEGVEVTFLGYSMRPERHAQGALPYAVADQDIVLAQLASAREAASGPIVLSLHWGDEYLHYPARWQVDLAHRFIDAGAAVVLGHHPHVLQGVEAYGAGVIVYSLGNFIFDKWQRAARETMVFRCELDREGLVGWDYEPVLIDRTFRVRRPTQAEASRIRAAVDRYSSAIPLIAEGSGAYQEWSDEAYARLAERAYLRFRIQSYLYFLRHLFRYEPRVIADSARRSLARRLGRE